MPSGRSRNNHRLPDRYEQFMTGELTVEDLDDDELARGQIKNKNGVFGKPPLVIPRSFLVRLASEMQQRVEAVLREDLPTMYGVMREQALNPKTRPDVRFEAAKYIIERLTGKIPDKSIVQQQITVWDSMIQGQGGTAEIIMDLPPAQLSAHAAEEPLTVEVVEDKAPPTKARSSTRAQPAKPSTRRRKPA